MENVLWIRVSTVTAIFDGHINGGKLDYPQWSAVITALPQIPKGLSCNLYICPFVLSGPSIHQASSSWNNISITKKSWYHN